jgi:hypothetical protein
MQERRFDELTRTLGRATSRRGVLKGLLGGVAAVLLGRSIEAPGAAAAGCSVAACKAEAYRQWVAYDQALCNNLCHDRMMFVACVGCRMNTSQVLQMWQHECDTGDGCLRAANQVCCNGSCANVASDPNNCGSCGHACESGSACKFGQCECADPNTMCDDHCVNTQSDHDNCGECGHKCSGCEMCALGECVSICTDDAPCCNDQCVSTKCDPPKEFDSNTCSCVCPPANVCGTNCCTDGQECCNGQCYDRCLDDAPRDPTTCECTCSDGIQCGTECCSYNDVCCNDHCVPSCPYPQHLDPTTCQCTCDSGEACGPFCCSEDKVCCPDTLTGMSCRDADANCPSCTYTCGDICCGQYEFCCRAADYSYHCVQNSGDTC